MHGRALSLGVLETPSTDSQRPVCQLFNEWLERRLDSFQPVRQHQHQPAGFHWIPDLCFGASREHLSSPMEVPIV